MYAPVQKTDTSGLPCEVIAATCCAECPNPPCARSCPNGINVQDVLKTLLTSHPIASRLAAIRGIRDFGDSAMD